MDEEDKRVTKYKNKNKNKKRRKAGKRERRMKKGRTRDTKEFNLQRTIDGHTKNKVEHHPHINYCIFRMVQDPSFKEGTCMATKDGMRSALLSVYSCTRAIVLLCLCSLRPSIHHFHAGTRMSCSGTLWFTQVPSFSSIYIHAIYNNNCLPQGHQHAIDRDRTFFLCFFISLGEGSVGRKSPSSFLISQNTPILSVDYE